MWRRLRRLNPRSDTDVVLITEDGCPSLPEALSLRASDLPLPDLQFGTNARISKATYWRLAAPRPLAKTYRKLLYLDVDILPVDATLFECFDYDLKQAPFAACQSPFHFVPNRQTEDGKVRDGKFTFNRYFNCGVMLIDVARYLEAEFSEKAYAVIEQHGSALKYHDQTALNIAARELWADLPLAYNFWAGALGTFLVQRMQPKIIHYHGAYKPWHLVTPFAERLLRLRMLRLRMLADVLAHGQIRMATSVTPRQALRRRRRNGVERTITEQNAALMSYLDRTAFVGR